MSDEEETYWRWCDRCGKVKLETDVDDECEVYMVCPSCSDEDQKQEEANEIAEAHQRSLIREQQAKTCDLCKQFIPNAIANSSVWKVCSKCYARISIFETLQ